MRIKQLELKGFKSFKNRTVIRFGKGTSCVVGPNGCGKSNIVDAFLWVMGETAPKHLRGSSMEDVIFGGTNKQAASGFAEVSLVMEKGKANIFPEPYKNCSEIMLTRRLDRDGKSEYLINSHPCRLKDVQEIFMDTGAGIHGFSFIEQGTVEQFILSKPEQKRMLIESAAGISKFRSRKRQAERKLELSEVNLKRLRDILSQQETQLGRLKKQSEKAEQFRDLKEKIREKDIQISKWDLSYLRQEKSSLDNQIRSFGQQSEERKKEVQQASLYSEELKSNYDRDKQEVEKTEQEVEEVKKLFFSLEREVAELKASVQVNKQNLSFQEERSYKKNRQAILDQIEDSENQIQQLEKKQSDLQKRWGWVKAEYEKLSESFTTSDVKRQSLETELMNCMHQEALSQERDQALLDKVKNEDRNIEEQKQLLQKKNKEAQKLQLQKKALVEKRDQKQQLTFNLTDSVQELKKEMVAFEEDVQVQEGKLIEAQKEALALHSKWESLKQLSHQMDLREKGVRFILASKQEEGVFSETATSIRLLSPLLETAVSSYLELRLKSVFCREEKQAISALNLLQEKKEGRCRVLLHRKKDSLSKFKKSLQKEVGFQFFLEEQIEGNEELIHLLFSHTVVVNKISTALSLKKKYPDWCFLTLEGEVLTQEGDLIGGDFSQEEMNILSYHRTIEKMSSQCAQKKNQVIFIEAQLKKTRELYQEVLGKISELGKQKDHFHVHVLGLKKDLEIVGRDEERLTEELSDIQRKILSCEKKQQEWKERRKRLQNEMTSSVDPGKIKLELKQMESECEKVEKEKHTLSVQKDQLWKEVANCDKELSSFIEKKSLLKQSLKDKETEEKNTFFRSLEIKKSIQKYEKDLAERETRKTELYKEMSHKEEHLHSLIQGQEKLREKITQIQTDIMEAHQKQTEEQSRINDIKLSFESLALKEQAVLEKIMEKYQLDLSSLDNRDVVSVFCEGKQEDQKVWFENFNKEAEEEILQKLNNRLARIGEVNFLALKEYEELKQENTFYQNQYEDLSRSNEKLSHVIKRIDAFCSKRFKEVFEKVNTCFSKVWPSLFEGGTAELVLTKDDEKGIEGMDIIVQLPGKRLQSMSLLSGGEKAMTAVAVIFSIFLIKPSPFCILDEVDAPLDDVNIIRFNSLLAEMAAVSQVIVITHNKYTMREAQTIYGVTMEEKGISKVMCLDMTTVPHQKEKNSPIRV